MVAPIALRADTRLYAGKIPSCTIDELKPRYTQSEPYRKTVKEVFQTTIASKIVPTAKYESHRRSLALQGCRRRLYTVGTVLLL